MQVAIAGGLKKIGETQYGKIDSFPLVFSTFLPLEIKNLENKWIKIDSESINKIIKLTSELSQGAVGMLEGATLPNEAMQKSEEFQKEITEKIKNILENRQFYLVDKQFSDEEINSNKAYHYKVSLNPEETAKIMTEVVKAVEESMLKEFGTAAYYPDNAKIQSGINEFLNKINGVSAEIWIGKKDGYIYKIKLDKEIDLAKLAEIAGQNNYSTSAGKSSVKLNIDINYSKFNQPVVIEAPVKSTPIEEVLIPLIEASIKDSAIESNLSYITSQMYNYFYQKKTYYGITCKNSTINSYCAEIKKITGKDPIIRGSKNYYCAYSELFSEENDKTKYYCVSNSYPTTSESNTNPRAEGLLRWQNIYLPSFFYAHGPDILESRFS